MKNLNNEVSFENLKTPFLYETTKENSIVFANGFFFGKLANATDPNHALSLLGKDLYTGHKQGSCFSKDFYCNDAIYVNL